MMAVPAAIHPLEGELPTQITVGPSPNIERPENLSLENLEEIITILRLAGERGAFRVDEFARVGRAHDILLAFLAANRAK